MCIKEGLRLHVLLYLLLKGQQQKNLTFMSMSHSAESRVAAIQIYSIHHNPHVWEDPLEFRPERFHSDCQGNMYPFQFVPFSASSRNCIGENFALNEMKVTVSQVVKNFKLTLDLSQTARRLPIVTMKPEKGIYIYATLRR